MAKARSAKQSAYLQAMGMTEWVLKDAREISEPARVETDDVAIQAGADAAKVTLDHIHDLDWDALREQVASCRLCELHQHRTQAVLGIGDLNANWMVIGEAPGEQEDSQGEPFVGRAGLLLNNMLLALGLKRESVYIANIVKCRPPGNRDPHVDEISTCLSYLQRQIELVQPSIILAAGRVAAQSLLQSDSPVGKMRGEVHHYGARNIPVVVTYHPAYLLRKPTEKIKAWADLKLALAAIQT